MQQRDVFSEQASIASWALFSLHRRKLYEYRNANGVKISVKMRSPEHYETEATAAPRMHHLSLNQYLASITVFSIIYDFI
ncbi:TPA: hypothetical protein JLF26_005129 [Escherichia coli]|nr:hypothetical protein [Escherichia coli]